MTKVTPDFYREPRGWSYGVVTLLVGVFIVALGWLYPNIWGTFAIVVFPWVVVSAAAEFLPRERTKWAGRLRIFGLVLLFLLMAIDIFIWE